MNPAAAQTIKPTMTLDVIKEDPPDNRILEYAVEGRAHVIVSGNRHLKRLKTYEGVAEAPKHKGISYFLLDMTTPVV